MQTSILLDRTMNEIVFEGRNKMYGAFDLRMNYEKIMSRAMLMGIFFFIVCFSIPSLFARLNSKDSEEAIKVIVCEFAPPPPIPSIKPTRPAGPPPSPIKPQMAYVPPVVVDDEEATSEAPPTQDDLSGKVIGNVNTEATGDGIDPSLISTPPESPGEPAEAIEEPSGPMGNYAVSQQAEFPDGIEALYKYVRKNLQVPSSAREMNDQINLVVQFVIDKEGKAYDIKVLRSNTSLINKAAIKVIEEMPRWKPAKHNGRPVEVIFNLPIRIQFE